MEMKRLTTRVYLTLLIVLATPMACFAADPGAGESLFEWVVRFLAWAAGGWHSL
jgi:hypothetical protein